jgi:hypothetical protein
MTSRRKLRSGFIAVDSSTDPVVSDPLATHSEIPAHSFLCSLFAEQTQKSVNSSTTNCAAP